MQTVPTTYYFDAGAQTDAAASASAGAGVATAREVGAMTLPLEPSSSRSCSARAGAAGARRKRRCLPDRAAAARALDLADESADAGGHADAAGHPGRADRHQTESVWVGVPAVTQTADTGTSVLTVEYQHKATVNRGADRRGGDRDGVRRDAERGAPPLSDRPTTASRVRRKFLERCYPSRAYAEVRDANVQQLVAQADPRRLRERKGTMSAAAGAMIRRTSIGCLGVPGSFGTEFRRQRRRRLPARALSPDRAV